MDKKKRLSFALVALALAVLACGTYVTPTATPLPTRRATALVSPSMTKTPVMETVMETPEPVTAIVRAAVINVRQSPDGDVIATLSAGNVVKIVVCRGNWCQIREPVEGWLWKGCLNLKSGLGCEAR